MKKMIALGLVFVAAALVVACNQSSSTGTPVSPQSTALSVSTERNNSYPVTLCHHAKGDDPAWVVIQVDNSASTINRHLRHGDYTTSTCSGLSGLAVEADCTCCTQGGCVPH
jgi:hypothetical protein